MNVENTRKLLMAFPRLYRSIATNNIEFAASSFFQVSDGWIDLLFELSKKIERAARYKNLHGDAWPDVQLIEAHYASLRFKLHRDIYELDSAASKYEFKSNRTCELCGRPGHTRQAGWLYTLCDQCAVTH